MTTQTKGNIIFDFDGTMADSFLTTIQVIYKATHNSSLPNEDISRLRSMNMYELSRALDISWWKLFFLTKRVRKLMRKKIKGLVLVPGMEEAINKLSQKYKLFVLSSNSTDNVQTFLNLNEIDVYFSGVLGDVNPLSKKRRLKQLIVQNGLSTEETCYVGDEILDIKAAKYAGIKSIAVTWGFSDIHRLKSKKPTNLIFDPSELCTLFNVQ